MGWPGGCVALNGVRWGEVGWRDQSRVGWHRRAWSPSNLGSGTCVFFSMETVLVSCHAVWAACSVCRGQLSCHGGAECHRHRAPLLLMFLCPPPNHPSIREFIITGQEQALRRAQQHHQREGSKAPEDGTTVTGGTGTANGSLENGGRAEGADLGSEEGTSRGAGAREASAQPPAAAPPVDQQQQQPQQQQQQQEPQEQPGGEGGQAEGGAEPMNT